MVMVMVMVTHNDFCSMAQFTVRPRSWAHCQNVHRQLFASNLARSSNLACLCLSVCLFAHLMARICCRGPRKINITMYTASPGTRPNPPLADTRTLCSQTGIWSRSAKVIGTRAERRAKLPAVRRLLG